MAIFKLNESVTTDSPVVEVESPPRNPLRPGVYVFSLVVEDDSGNRSAAAHTKVTVSDPGPTAVIRVESEVVPFGAPFKLIGDESSDIPPGKIVRYIWTLVE